MSRLADLTLLQLEAISLDNRDISLPTGPSPGDNTPTYLIAMSQVLSALDQKPKGNKSVNDLRCFFPL
ncbi:MAG: hypothetical protein F7B19_07355, partial [Desulfurococcales archaeon]|nr:hypothetical protein [Desulfurococcales archaeon]